MRPLGTHFACFTGTKAQRLTQKALCRGHAPLRYSLYLLYWYKSTNTDAEGAADWEGFTARETLVTWADVC
jgi:hypothetical protein